jgi:hypothetical protein
LVLLYSQGPHLLETLGYGPGEIGVAFAVIAAVYAAFTPVAGCARLIWQRLWSVVPPA